MQSPMLIAQHLLFHAPKLGLHGGDQGDDVDTMPALLDHAGEAAHLAFVAVQALDARGFG